MKVYPIFLNDLSGRRCVVFGGGHEAERKVEELLACDAAVDLVSPEATDVLRRLAEDRRITWRRRAYRPGDLRGAFLTIISETNPEATAPIWEEAQAERVLINAMDDVPHCTFVAGSIVRRGPLVISISTSGSAPALAVRLRERLERDLGPEYATFLELMQDLRERMFARYPDFEERRRRWYALVDSDVLDLLRAGRVKSALQRIEDLIDDAHVPGEAPPGSDIRQA